MPDRILQGTAATITVTFMVDGVYTDPSPDTATVTIRRADGTVLVNAATATESGTGRFQYTLLPAETGLLDTLTAAWTAAVSGVMQTIYTSIEVVGGYLFSIAQARTVEPLSNSTTYATPALIEARTYAEQALEDAIGYALVPRYTRKRVSTRLGPVDLGVPYVTAIRDVVVDGVALSAAEVADVWFDGGILAGWGSTRPRSMIVGFEHGLDRAPIEASDAALILAKHRLVKGPVDDRATQIASEFGGVINLSTPGVFGARFGLPFVDAFIANNRMPAVG